MAQETGQGARRRFRRRGVGALLTAAVACTLAACSWGSDPGSSDGGTVAAEETTSRPDPGGGGGGSPVKMSTAAQQEGLPFAGVHDAFVDDMTAECGGTLCVTVRSDPTDADDGCSYSGSSPPWQEYIERGSTVTLLADCGAPTTDPGTTDSGTTDPGTTDGSGAEPGTDATGPGDGP